MSIKLNSIARRRVLDTIFPLIPASGGGYESQNFRLGLYSGPSLSNVAPENGGLPSVNKLAEYYLSLKITPDGRMVYLDANYTVIQAVASGKVGSWVLMNAENAYDSFVGTSVADQASGEAACLILNDLNTVKGDTVQLVDFSFKIG